jgi:phage tail-like protein
MGDAQANALPLLALVATVKGFSLAADSPLVLELFGSAPRPIAVPDPPATDYGAAWDSYNQAVREFAARYQSPESVLAGLNDREVLLQQNQTDLEFLRRFAPRSLAFQIESNGTILGRFEEVEGLEPETEVVEYRVTGTYMTGKLPGGTGLPPTITLKRGKSRSAGLFEWHQEFVINGSETAEPIRDLCALPPGAEQDQPCGATAAAGYDGQPVARYHLENAWPKSWQAASLAIDPAEPIAMETVTITCENIQRVAP